MAFPIFFRRLFANEGAGPLLRGDILPFGSTAGTVCQGDDARLTRAASTSAEVDAWRLTWIGVPRWWRSTTLPPHHVWADGSLVLFEDWPEFKACYDAGGFEGMLLPAGSDSAAIAANLGKWVEHPNSLGLYTPSLGGQFFRVWGQGIGREAGGYQSDAMRNLTGSIAEVADMRTGIYGFLSLRNYNVQTYLPQASGTNWFKTTVDFNASYQVPTDVEFRSANVSIPLVTYLGFPR